MKHFKLYFTNIILLIVFSALTVVAAAPYYVTLTAFLMLWLGKLHIVINESERLANNVKTIVQEYIGHLYAASLFPDSKKPMLPDLKELDETVIDTVYCIVLILFVLVI